MIIILTQCFPSRVGGIESLMSNLALELGKKEKVVVFADQHHLLNDTIFDNKNKNKIIIKRFGGLKYFRRRKKVKELKNFILSKKIKMVIADTWKSLELLIDLLNKNNIHSICLAHGNELISNNNFKNKRIFETLNKSSSIICNSQFTINLVKRILPNIKNISFIHPGADDLRNNNLDNFLKIEGNPVLITLSRLEKRKGHAEILMALKKLISDFPKLHYIIAGEGDEKENLKKIVKRNLLESHVSFTGLVNDSQKKYLFSKSDLMVMPTLDESINSSIEGFGIAYIEAAFFGIPSIASDIGGTNEAVLHNKTGIIIKDMNKLYESINELLNNNEKRKELGKQAQKRANEDFNWDSVANKYLKTFKS